MSPLLAGLLLVPFLDGLVAILLIRFAWEKPYINALIERAALAVGITVLTTVYAVAAANIDLGYPFFNLEDGRLLVRTVVLVIGLAPTWWLYLWLARKFGDD